MTKPDSDHRRPDQAPSPPSRLLITAGPTHEPIDAVRYLGNRSSGTLGIALADAAAQRGWRVTLLLGPTQRQPSHPSVHLQRFQTTADLQALLAAEWPGHDALVMAAAVADYRPKTPARPNEKLRRTDAGLSIELESTPDLLAGCSAARRAGQVLVGFALEPVERLAESSRSKLARKGVDLIVANPLETMESAKISARLFHKDGREEPTPEGMTKAAFASWLLDRLALLAAEAGMTDHASGSRQG